MQLVVAKIGLDYFDVYLRILRLAWIASVYTWHHLQSFMSTIFFTYLFSSCRALPAKEYSSTTLTHLILLHCHYMPIWPLTSSSPKKKPRRSGRGSRRCGRRSENRISHLVRPHLCFEAVFTDLDCVERWLERPEESDNRTLYERLKEQKDKHQEEWEEQFKFS